MSADAAASSQSVSDLQQRITELESENVRLYAELLIASQQQTASSEVLEVINSSSGDQIRVFETILKKAHAFCGVAHGSLQLFDGENFYAVALHNVPEEVALKLRQGYNPGSYVPVQQLLEGASFFHVHDLAEIDHPIARAAAKFVGTTLYLALRRDSRMVGQIVAAREVVRDFSDKEITLLQSFAQQAVIAMENARLISETRDSLERLKAAQANLIQAEKMASLGQLTAGIAHEIKNPLNFVNNFAGLSGELLEELKETMDSAIATLSADVQAQIDEVVDTLSSNLAKIVEHGKRADGIVCSMLEHSRGSTGERRSVDLNGLVEEALNLAYHGARAQDQRFSITLKKEFGVDIPAIELVPQDMTRVFLNLFGNGFYAVRQRQHEDGEDGYQPTLRVSTRDVGEAVEIRVRDNGTGVAPDVRDKLFQPFFTTKPTGEGTGLGLSISYDIITQQHGGTIEVESEPYQFTEFTVRLPRARRAAASAGGA